MNTQNVRHIVASIIGSLVEWYDFSIFVLLASTIRDAFFPQQTPFTGLVLTFSIFAVSFVARPLGAFYFGRLGDQAGRKPVFSWSILLMGLSSVLLALLPVLPQQTVLVLLLTVLRFVQGVAASGELGTALVFVQEHAPANRRGLWGSLLFVGVFSGILLASGVASLLTHYLSQAQLQAWGWRVAIVLGGVLALIGLPIRRYCHETPVFQAQQRDIVALPRKQVITSIVSVILLNLLPAVAFWLLFSYFVTYAHTVLQLPLLDALRINTYNLMVLIIATPLFGYVADRFHGRHLLLGSSIAMLALTFPLFMLFSWQTVSSVFIAQCIFAILLAAYFAAMPMIILETVGFTKRNMIVGVGFNLAGALFAGTAPLLMTVLTHVLHTAFVPAVYLSVISFISVCFLLRLRRAT